MNLRILNANYLICLKIVGAVSIAQLVAQSFQFYESYFVSGYDHQSKHNFFLFAFEVFPFLSM
jgi:hypothetical protein